jgi:hypothetical protein
VVRAHPTVPRNILKTIDIFESGLEALGATFQKVPLRFQGRTVCLRSLATKISAPQCTSGLERASNAAHN